MSDFENQYNSPETPVVPEKSQVAGNLTSTMLNYLKEASPWLRFVGVLGFISCGSLVLFGVIFVIISIATSGYMDDFGNVPIWLLSPFYIALGAFYFFPSRFIFLFGTKINKYLYSNSDDDLEQAFKNNKSLWKFIGILCIVSLATIPFVMIVMTVIGVIAAAGMF
jgi:hypothetical protein